MHIAVAPLYLPTHQEAVLATTKQFIPMAQKLSNFSGRHTLLQHPNVALCRQTKFDLCSRKPNKLVVKKSMDPGAMVANGPAASKRTSNLALKAESQPGKICRAAHPCTIHCANAINGLAPRHVDLRLFVLVSSNEITVTPGSYTCSIKKGISCGKRLLVGAPKTHGC